MSFLTKLIDFITLSRVGKLLGSIIRIVRGKIDSDGNGEVSVEEVKAAIPNDVSKLFKAETLLKNIPLIIEVVVELQKDLKK